MVEDFCHSGPLDTLKLPFAIILSDDFVVITLNLELELLPL
jgi:hypothetical protein